MFLQSYRINKLAFFLIQIIDLSERSFEVRWIKVHFEVGQLFTSNSEKFDQKHKSNNTHKNYL